MQDNLKDKPDKPDKLDKPDKRIQKNRRLGRKCTGVITVDIGKPTDPVPQALEAFCIVNEMTVSEAVRHMIRFGLTQKKML